MVIARALVFLVLLMLPVAACKPPLIAGQSLDSRYLLALNGDIGVLLRRYDDVPAHEELWVRQLGTIDSAAVAEDGRLVVLLRGRELEMLDEHGHHLHSQELMLPGRQIRGIWLCRGVVFIELTNGEVLRTNGRQPATAVSSIRSLLLSKSVPDQVAFRLAMMHGMKGLAPQSGRPKRSASRFWRATRLGKLFRVEDLDSDQAPVLRGILKAEDFLPLLKLGPGLERTSALRVLADLRYHPALSQIRRLASKDPEAVQALASILQEEAAPELHRFAKIAPAVVSEFYEQVPHPPAVPALMTILPLSREALVRQLRVDVGATSEAWENYRKTGERRGDPSELLWQARTAESSLLEKRARLVSVLPSRDWTPFRLDGQALWVLSGFRDPSEAAWELRTGTPTAVLQAKCWYVSENGRTQATTDGDSVLFRRDGVEWTVSGTLDALSPDGSWATVSTFEACTLINVALRQSQRLRNGQYCFTADSKSLLGPSLYDLKTSPAVALGESPLHSPLALFDSILLGGDYGLSSWELSTGRLRKDLVPYLDYVLSPSGRFATTTTRHELVVRDSATGKQVSPAGMQGTGVVGWSQDEHLLAAADSGGITVYRDYQPAHHLRMPNARTRTLTFSPDGRYLAAGMDDAIRVWDLQPTHWEACDLDLQLTSELWTGMRLDGGAARLLSREEWTARQQRWTREQGTLWWDGPGRRPPVTRRQLESLAGAAALVVLALLWRWRRR